MNQLYVVATSAAAVGVATLCSDMVGSVHKNSPVSPWEFMLFAWKLLQSIIHESLVDCLECLQILWVWRNGSSLYTRARPSTQVYHLNYVTHKQPSCSYTSYYQFYESPFHLFGFPQWSSDQTLNLSSSSSLLAVILPWHVVVIAS